MVIRANSFKNCVCGLRPPARGRASLPSAPHLGELCVHVFHRHKGGSQLFPRKVTPLEAPRMAWKDYTVKRERI